MKVLSISGNPQKSLIDFERSLDIPTFKKLNLEQEVLLALHVPDCWGGSHRTTPWSHRFLATTK